MKAGLRQLQVLPAATPQRRKMALVSVLGLTQILAWGTTFYLPAILAAPIAAETGWRLATVVAGLSWGLLVAGSLSPRVGRIIDRHGGREVLTASSLLIALGLVLLSLAEGLPLYFAAWSVLGLGMAAGLYDACFALLGRLYGRSARSAITGLTLYGGLASTLCWPVLAALEQALGWRETCLVIAGVHLAVAGPLHYWVIPSQPIDGCNHRPRASPNQGTGRPGPEVLTDRRFVLVCSAFTVLAFVMSSLSVHLLEILRLSGIAPATAIAIGMLIGPAQVGGRALEFLLGRRLHPVWSARVGALLCLCGTLILANGNLYLGFAAAAIYGVGNGILTIARGTLPLALFGSESYGQRMGFLARPVLFAQASAPVLTAMLMAIIPMPQVLMALGALLLTGCALFIRLQVDPAGVDAPSV